MVATWVRLVRQPLANRTSCSRVVKELIASDDRRSMLDFAKSLNLSFIHKFLLREFKGLPGRCEVECPAEADPDGLGAGWWFTRAVVVPAQFGHQPCERLECRRTLGGGDFVSTPQVGSHSAFVKATSHEEPGDSRLRCVINITRQAMIL